MNVKTKTRICIRMRMWIKFRTKIKTWMRIIWMRICKHELRGKMKMLMKMLIKMKM